MFQAEDGQRYKHDSGYYHEVDDTDVATRFDKVAIVNKNADGTWAYKGKCGISVAPADAFEADPVCDQKKITVKEGRNQGKTGVIVGEPKALPGTELGGDADRFKVLLDGRTQKSSFARKQLAFPYDQHAPPAVAMPSAPAALVKGGGAKTEHEQRVRARKV